MPSRVSNQMPLRSPADLPAPTSAPVRMPAAMPMATPAAMDVPVMRGSANTPMRSGSPPAGFYDLPTTPPPPGAVYKKGGKVSSASKRADGIATKGKTKGTMITMKNGGKC
jgi:hypothetical protein